ncbi:Retrovirus-related Pol polyprotein from transposon 297,Retrovirus-related Pol polyprotein from transposon 17.6,Transposon Ty3-I Gag-Pol polyprotein,Transposon Ty3-G Gag-Pol polyprotein,Retrovirus-related Pol polyprotein from transposon 412 [Mytilus coruscus]|uniref:Reverse transcriptase domain-containing protein n=1 Tax=Mytilus coruscus TaxID=42192 RepID=A0A6J8CB94_MYTCO|nr:Retrovirus-related Pol polyprotein from transposon 297,Retrovirus-related Pol polyprotein from transposon 17.6,Transposon Ty3-I Gag-Pol polyprotein,Transposon Ty3-G Gag-Pol polyprotein,Retrovirus-related Pol polyprotein from transposon 412 [Mytilus coruscus]
MASSGIIEPSSSAWCSPVVMVTKKKDQSIRFCIDFRKNNVKTEKDCQPIPRIEDTLDTLSGSKWFSTLDMRSGYWQCGLDEKDREKTAFAIPGSGLWQFKVLCFGLCGAPATFERLVEKIFSGLTWRICLVYLDDIIVFSKTFDEHLKNLSEVCDRLRSANLKLHPKKCFLLQKEGTFLGHKVSHEGINTDDEKIKAVQDWPTPKNVKDVRSFIGLCSYYRRFVENFSTIAKPLHQLIEKCKKFEWTEACNCSFEHLKKLLISAPILGYPINDGGFILETDASNVGMGAVLSQIQDGEERVIGYFSKTFSKSERNYCVNRKELLAIVSAVKNFHHYLYGRSFTVRTDHGSLRWLVNFKNPEGQLARWLETLGAYDFQIPVIHRPGRIHSNADALSRRPCPDDCSYCSKVEDKFSNVGLGEVEINNEISTKEVVKSVVVDDTNTLTGAVKVEGSQV